MSPRAIQPHHAVCMKCGKQCISERKDRDICRKCYRGESSNRCIRCGKMRHYIATETGLCPLCASRPEAICASCQQTRIIYNQEDQLCKTCNTNKRTAIRKKNFKLIKVECSICGEMRPSYRFQRAICRLCYEEEQNGRKLCSQCNKIKVIAKKAEGLCKQCNYDRLAPKALRRFVISYTTSYPYNQFLFEFLAATIDWESVTEKTNRTFRAFGRFLQIHQIEDPLTWETIEELLPELGPTNRTVPKMIRASLFDLGYLLAAKNKIESRDVYIAKRNALLPIGQAPDHIQNLLHRYAAWLCERQHVTSSIREHLETLASFWSWCDQLCLRSLEEVHSKIINGYLLTLYWQWQCVSCHGFTMFDPHSRKAPELCTHCRAVHSLAKVERYAQNTVRRHRAKLLVFFDWAKINRLVITNPVQRKTPAPDPTISHYPPEVIKQLCMYLAALDAEPLEAMVLYLIIFHAFSVQELRYVEIPILKMQKGNPLLKLSEAYSVIIPKFAPSLGRYKSGRPDVRLDFPQKAEIWLKPLLERFENWRQQFVRDPSNRYLLIAPSKARHNTPVGHVFVWEIVRCASLRVLGAACNPNTLRKTVGVMFADTAGAGVLSWMGWGEQQAFAYTWAARKTIHPTQLNSSKEVESQSNIQPIIFPSPREKDP